MIYNKKRMALLAGIDSRDQYFGKTLRESSLWEAEDDLDAAEDEEEAPLDVGGEEDAELEDEGGDEEAVPKEEIVDALAPMLGVDAEELSALVSGEEGGEEDAELEDEGGDEEGGDDLELESDVIVVDDSEESFVESDVVVVDAGDEEVKVHESRLRRAIRGEIRKVINEVMIQRDMNQISHARRTKSVSAIMGYKAARPAFTPTRTTKRRPASSRRLRTGKGFKK